MTADMRALVARQREAAAATPPIAALDVPLPVVEAEAWNAAHKVGTPVVAYPGARPPKAARRLVTRTRSAAWVADHGKPVVMVDGLVGWISLTHVDVLTSRPATDGEGAEFRHLLYDADPDATTRPFVDLRKGRKP